MLHALVAVVKNLKNVVAGEHMFNLDIDKHSMKNYNDIDGINI